LKVPKLFYVRKTFKIVTFIVTLVYKLMFLEVYIVTESVELSNETAYKTHIYKYLDNVNQNCDTQISTLV
jgi:hypothetical protein